MHPRMRSKKTRRTAKKTKRKRVRTRRTKRVRKTYGGTRLKRKQSIGDDSDGDSEGKDSSTSSTSPTTSIKPPFSNISSIKPYEPSEQEGDGDGDPGLEIVTNPGSDPQEESPYHYNFSDLSDEFPYPRSESEQLEPVSEPVSEPVEIITSPGSVMKPKTVSELYTNPDLETNPDQEQKPKNRLSPIHPRAASASRTPSLK